jgi:alcohol dehydrogenase
VIFGAGTIDRLGELAREYGGRRVLLVTDKGVEEAGHGEHGAAALGSAGLHVVIFDEVTQNPTTDDIDHALDVAGASRSTFWSAWGAAAAWIVPRGSTSSSPTAGGWRITTESARPRNRCCR